MATSLPTALRALTLGQRLSVSATSSSAAARPSRCPAALSFSTSSAASAAAKKAPVKKKKVALKKKSSSGPRGEGGKRKGGTEGAGSVRASEWAQPKPDMRHLELLNADSASSSVGSILAYSPATLAALEHFGLPKQLGARLKSQPRPRTLIRAQSSVLFREMEQAGAQNAAAQASTSVLHGPTGSGASTLLVQSVAHALDQGWVVLYLPSLISLVNSTSPYTFDATQKTYLQPQLAQQILSALTAVNEARLKEIPVGKEALEAARAAAAADASSSSSSSDTSVLKEGATLHALVTAGTAKSASPFLSQVLLETVLRTLATQTSVPFLLAMDDFQALYSASRYRDPDYRQLQAYELAVPRVLLQLVRQWKVRRGLVLGALSEERAPLAFPQVAHELYAVLGLTGKHVEVGANSFADLHRTHLRHVEESGLRVRHVMAHDLSADAANATKALVTPTFGLQRSEAGALFDCLKRERGIFSPANDELFLSKLIESGGNLGLFERGLQRTLV